MRRIVIFILLLTIPNKGRVFLLGRKLMYILCYMVRRNNERITPRKRKVKHHGKVLWQANAQFI